MDFDRRPLVSVVTPVYNGEEFLRECIESVLAQTYSSWRYVIVDNCSTDRTFDIASEYASRDPRIHVQRTDRFVNAVANYNNAIRQTSHRSAYCKVVAADDWLYPTCLQQMVELAEAYPSVGDRRRLSAERQFHGREGTSTPDTRDQWKGRRPACNFLAGRTCSGRPPA